MATGVVATTAGGVDARRLRWGNLLTGSASAVGVFHGIVAAVLTDIDAAALFVLFAAALAARRRWPHGLTPVLGLLLADVAFFTGAATLAHLRTGATVTDVAVPATMLVGSAVGLVAAVGAWRAPRSTAGTLPLTVAGLAALAGLLTIAAVGSAPVAPVAGDLQVVGANTRFAPAELEATPGTVRVHLTNHDYFWHTFSVPELGVRLAVPMNGRARVEFDAPAGTYAYVCEIPGHEGVMRGTLLVGP